VEEIYRPGTKIETQKMVIFVARGIVIEKIGALDDPFAPSLKFKRGTIACLQNLLPDQD
jgi:hypothetical protein